MLIRTINGWCGYYTVVSETGFCKGFCRVSGLDWLQKSHWTGFQRFGAVGETVWIRNFNSRDDRRDARRTFDSPNRTRPHENVFLSEDDRFVSARPIQNRSDQDFGKAPYWSRSLWQTSDLPLGFKDKIPLVRVSQTVGHHACPLGTLRQISPAQKPTARSQRRRSRSHDWI